MAVQSLLKIDVAPVQICHFNRSDGEPPSDLGVPAIYAAGALADPQDSTANRAEMSLAESQLDKAVTTTAFPSQ